MNTQEDWDTCLLNGFYHHQDCNILFLYQQFTISRKLSMEESSKIKRIPRTPWHGKSTVLRFICAYLPKIADILWKHKPEEIEQIAKIMAKSSYDTQIEMKDNVQYAREKAQFVRDDKKYKEALTKKSEFHKRFTSRNRNNTWGVTK